MLSIQFDSCESGCPYAWRYQGRTAIECAYLRKTLVEMPDKDCPFVVRE